MKRTCLYLLLSLLTLTSCNDFFDTDPDDITNTGDYISKTDEMYKGFLGILTKMQQAGDQAIFLTDTRGDYFEATGNAPVELQDIYNYQETQGNSYADPLCYYSVIIACNDYIDKMRQYHEKLGNSMEEKTETNFNCLISSALRIKVWAYYTIGRIYGKAIWFDDPLDDLKNLNDSVTFTKLDNMKAIVNKCLDVMNNGISVYNGEQIMADLDMDWVAWLDPESENVDKYRYWDYLTPNWLLLKCELLSWRGEPADWSWIRDNILDYLYTKNIQVADTYIEYPGYMYACNIPLTVSYYNQFFSEQIGYKYEFISGIMVVLLILGTGLSCRMIQNEPQVLPIRLSEKYTCWLTQQGRVFLPDMKRNMLATSWIQRVQRLFSTIYSGIHHLPVFITSPLPIETWLH